jgi:hypothetical protein
MILRLTREEICQAVSKIEVLTVEAEDGTWVMDKLLIHTRKGVIKATADGRVLPQLKTHKLENSNESNS